MNPGKQLPGASFQPLAIRNQCIHLDSLLYLNRNSSRLFTILQGAFLFTT
jgi:hypothetical protein